MPRKNLVSVAFIFVLFTVFAHRAIANDTSYGEQNGSIIFTQQPAISMDKEVLVIGETEIRVDYTFTNTGKTDLTVPVAFPMPPMYFGPSDHSRITDFKLWVDGVPVKTKRKLLVLLDDRTDISARIAALGWREKDLIGLLTGQAQPKNKKPLPDDWFVSDDEPRFTLNEYFVWDQHFAPGKAVNIKHTYTPSVETGVPRSATELIEGYGKPSCMDAKTRSLLKKRDRPDGISWAYLSYILKTANNWQGPIKDFTLRLQKQTPTDIVSLCFDGELKKVDPLTFEFHEYNYKPVADLSVFFNRM